MSCGINPAVGRLFFRQASTYDPSLVGKAIVCGTTGPGLAKVE